MPGKGTGSGKTAEGSGEPDHLTEKDLLKRQEKSFTSSQHPPRQANCPPDKIKLLIQELQLGQFNPVTEPPPPLLSASDFLGLLPSSLESLAALALGRLLNWDWMKVGILLPTLPLGGDGVQLPQESQTHRYPLWSAKGAKARDLDTWLVALVMKILDGGSSWNVRTWARSNRPWSMLAYSTITAVKAIESLAASTLPAIRKSKAVMMLNCRIPSSL